MKPVIAELMFVAAPDPVLCAWDCAPPWSKLIPFELLLELLLLLLLLLLLYVTTTPSVLDWKWCCCPPPALAPTN